MLEIAYLADIPEAIPTLVDWFRLQWSEYYARRTLAEIAQDFTAEANRSALPVRLVAFADVALAGTITLREHAHHSLPEYRPGLGGLFVAEQYRRQGIGAALISAGMDLARQQGFAKVYATTLTAGGILERLGWQPLWTVSHGNEQTVLYRCDLNKSAQPEKKSPGS